MTDSRGATPQSPGYSPGLFSCTIAPAIPPALQIGLSGLQIQLSRPRPRLVGHVISNPTRALSIILARRLVVSPPVPGSDFQPAPVLRRSARPGPAHVFAHGAHSYG